MSPRDEVPVAATESLPTRQRTTEGALREILDRHPRGCGVIHGSRPPGYTCLDRKRDAADPSSRYGEEFRQAILAGENDCDVCIAREALEALEDGR